MYIDIVLNKVFKHIKKHLLLNYKIWQKKYFNAYFKSNN